MTNPRKTRTNAADSAPGVDDGPAGVKAPPVNSRPIGRGVIWIAVIVVLLIVLAIFFTRPFGVTTPDNGAASTPAPAGPAQPVPPQTGAPG